MYSIVGSDLSIHFLFCSSSRGARARFRRYNSCTHSITKKPYKNYRQVHTIEHTHKQLFTFRYVLSQCTLLQVLIYGLAWFLAHFREGPEPIFGVITLVHILSQKKPTKNCRQVHTIEYIHKNYLHLGLYLNNVLYCRFSFMNSLDFQLIFERGWSPFSAL